MQIHVPAALGGLFLAIGMIVWGILALVGQSLPPLVIALWAIITGLLILVGR